MFLMRMERQIEKFYAAWSPSLLAFCCLLLGEGSDAERTVVEAFQAYLGRGLDLDFGRLPAFLFIFAIDAAKRAAFPATPETAEARRLQDAVVLLPWRERAVFALRSTMGLDDMVVGEIVEIPVQEVRRIWMRALFRLRELLPKDFSPGRKT
jgi:DNA-directed RNA polymerase specialized sigma24 family protein